MTITDFEPPLQASSSPLPSIRVWSIAFSYIDVLKQWDSGHVDVPNQYCGIPTLFLYIVETLLLFSTTFIAHCRLGHQPLTGKGARDLLTGLEQAAEVERKVYLQCIKQDLNFPVIIKIPTNAMCCMVRQIACEQILERLKPYQMENPKGTWEDWVRW